MNIIDYNKNPKQICFEANTEEESKLLIQVKQLLQKYLPTGVIAEKKSNDFLILNI